MKMRHMKRNVTSPHGPKIAYEFVGNDRIAIEVDGEVLSRGEFIDDVLANYAAHNCPADELRADQAADHANEKARHNEQ